MDFHAASCEEMLALRRRRIRITPITIAAAVATAMDVDAGILQAKGVSKSRKTRQLCGATLGAALPSLSSPLAAALWLWRGWACAGALARRVPSCGPLRRGKYGAAWALEHFFWRRRGTRAHVFADPQLPGSPSQARPLDLVVGLVAAWADQVFFLQGQVQPKTFGCQNHET